LCCLPITDGQPSNVDHKPPLRVFGKQVWLEYSLNLKTLPTHTSCNTAYKDDEEYFVVALAGDHRHTATGAAVWNDIRRGAAQGHGLGLLQTVIKSFGKVQLADGSRMLRLDHGRIGRAAWKIARG